MTKEQKNKKVPWYIAGLHFECSQCGACCSGPDQGYIWLTKQEIKLLADLLKEPIAELHRKYLGRVGFRTTIIEHPVSRDCIFLKEINGRRSCTIYPVRPNQCRTWPFWASNLGSPTAWNQAARRCPGINRGRYYSFEEIEKIRKTKKWWGNES